MANAPQNNGKPADCTGADAIRENLKKTEGSTNTVLDRQKMRGDEMAKKHGG